jgi:hypothetical protein
VDRITHLFAANEHIQAAANIFALLAGVALIGGVFRALWRFAVNSYHTSIKRAVRAWQLKTMIIAFRCAQDVQYCVAAFAQILGLQILYATGLVYGFVGFTSYAYNVPDGGWERAALFVLVPTYGIAFLWTTYQVARRSGMVRIYRNRWRRRAHGLPVRRARNVASSS